MDKKLIKDGLENGKGSRKLDKVKEIFNLKIAGALSPFFLGEIIHQTLYQSNELDKFWESFGWIYFLFFYFLLIGFFSKKFHDIDISKNKYELMNKRYERASHAAKISSWEYDFDSGIITSSGDFIESRGLQEYNNNMNIDMFRSYIHPDDKYLFDEFMKRFNKANDKKQDGFEMNLEFRFINNEHKEYWIWLTGALYIEKKRFIGVGTLLDITIPKKAEIKAKENENLLEAIFHGMPDGVTLQDLDYKILKTNKQIGKLLNKSIPDILGKKCYEIRGFDQICGQCPIELCKKSSEIEMIEKQIPGKDNIVQIFGIPIMDENNNIVNVIEIIRDVTKQKKLQQRLINSEKKYRNLFENAPNPTFVEDASDVKIYFEELINSGIGDLRDYFKENPQEISKVIQKLKLREANYQTMNVYKAPNKEMLLEKINFILVDQEAKQQFVEGFIRLFEKKYKFDVYTKNQNLQNETIDVMVRWVLASEHKDNWKRVVISIVDISEISNLKEKLEASIARLEETSKIIIKQETSLEIKKMFDEFFHDYSKIYLSLYTFAKLLKDDVNEFEQYIKRLELNDNFLNDNILLFRDKVLHIISQLEKVYKETKNMQQHGKIGAGESQIINIKDEIIQRVALDKQLFLKANVNVELNFSNDDTMIQATSGLLANSILNLIHNAIEAFEGTDIENKNISVFVQNIGGNRIVIKVIDNGKGMDNEKQKHIFDEYVTDKKDKESHGLGLHIVKKHIEQLGGKINCISTKGIGTGFNIVLPILNLKSNVDNSSLKIFKSGVIKKALDNENKDHLKVLMVDDDQLCAQAIKTEFERSGFVGVEIVSDLSTVMDKLLKNKYDLLILDEEIQGEKGSNFMKVLIRQPNIYNGLVFMSSGSLKKIEKINKGVLKTYYQDKKDLRVHNIPVGYHKGANDDYMFFVSYALLIKNKLENGQDSFLDIEKASSVTKIDQVQTGLQPVSTNNVDTKSRLNIDNPGTAFLSLLEHDFNNLTYPISRVNYLMSNNIDKDDFYEKKKQLINNLSKLNDHLEMLRKSWLDRFAETIKEILYIRYDKQIDKNLNLDQEVEKRIGQRWKEEYKKDLMEDKKNIILDLIKMSESEFKSFYIFVLIVLRIIQDFQSELFHIVDNSKWQYDIDENTLLKIKQLSENLIACNKLIVN